MELPILCPMCKDILMTDYNPGGYLTKSCIKKIDHTFSCTARPWENNIYKIAIATGIYRELIIHWNIQNRTITVQRRGSIIASHFPFIEIDITDPFKTINKIKTLLTFI